MRSQSVLRQTLTALDGDGQVLDVLLGGEAGLQQGRVAGRQRNVLHQLPELGQRGVDVLQVLTLRHRELWGGAVFYNCS